MHRTDRLKRIVSDSATPISHIALTFGFLYRAEWKVGKRVCRDCLKTYQFH